jgi:lysozyme family protein
MFKHLFESLKWWLHLSPRVATIAGTVPTGFNTWIQFILDDEDPTVNESPDEPGGISCWGISLFALQDYYKAQKLPPATADDVRNLTSVSAATFYNWFLSTFMLDQVSIAIAYRISDLVVTLGRVGAVEAVCVALGIYPIPTAMTQDIINSINAADQKQLIWALSGVWLATKRSLTPTGKIKYGHGWNNRRNNAHTRAIALVTA